MRKLPTRKEIRERAEARFMGRLGSLPAITPEPYELKESGHLYEARRELMSNRWKGEQLKYLDAMAHEMKLTVIPKRGLRTLKKETGYEWTNGWTRPKKPTPKPKPKAKPKPAKKRKKRRVERAGEVPRSKAIRKRIKDGQKVFSFPDHIWKVKPVRKKKRRRKKRKK